MSDKDVFIEATRVEHWTHLAGTGAAARARSASLRRTRYAGAAGATAATAAVAVGVAAIAGAFGGSGGSKITAGTLVTVHPTAKITSRPSSPPSSPPAGPSSQAPVKGTMGALFEQWKSCPDVELVVVNELSQDPANLQQARRDACRRDVATLSALLPGYDVTPAVATVGTSTSGPTTVLGPGYFDNPSAVIPPGYTPRMGTATYRIVAKNGVTSKVFIHALDHDDKARPATGAAVTLPNGLQAWLTLGAGISTGISKGRPVYEIYILSQGRTFYFFTIDQPNFDFKTLVTSPQFAAMAAEALAEPET